MQDSVLNCIWTLLYVALIYHSPVNTIHNTPVVVNHRNIEIVKVIWLQIIYGSVLYYAFRIIMSFLYSRISKT